MTALKKSAVYDGVQYRFSDNTKRPAKSFYCKTAFQAVYCTVINQLISIGKQKRFAKSFYCKTAFQAVYCTVINQLISIQISRYIDFLVFLVPKPRLGNAPAGEAPASRDGRRTEAGASGADAFPSRGLGTRKKDCKKFEC